MSKERIEYETASAPDRVVALVVDAVVVVIVAVVTWFGALLENELIWKTVAPGLHLELPMWIIIWFIIEFPLYYILVSGFMDGQTLGKLILGIRVVNEDNSSTKRAYTLHLKRFIFVRSGTKVVKEHDPGVKGLE